MLGNSVIKVYKSFHHEFLLITAVGATTGGAIDKCMMTSDVVGADAPFSRIFRDLTEEDENGEAGSKFVLLEFDTSRPIPHAMVRRCRRLLNDSWISRRMNIHMCLAVISDLSCRRMMLWSCTTVARRSCWYLFGSCRTRIVAGRGCWYLFGRIYKITNGRWDSWHSREWTESRRPIELVDSITNHGLSGVGVCSVNSVEVWISITKFARVCNGNRRPESGLIVPEWR